jgi:hypothetical protein
MTGALAGRSLAGRSVVYHIVIANGLIVNVVGWMAH